MLKPLKYITTINDFVYATSYLYNKEDHLVFPVSFNVRSKEEGVPGIHDTFKRTLASLGALPPCLKIYKYEDSIFYTYLSISFQNRVLDINIRFFDGMKIAKLCKLQVLVEENLLEEQGVKVSKEMIESAMKTDVNPFL